MVVCQPRIRVRGIRKNRRRRRHLDDNTRMTTKTYGILDPHAVGPSEEIQQGGTVATCNVDAQDIHRLIRGSIGFAPNTGMHYVEFTFYGEGDIAGLIACGLVTAAHPLSMYVGEDASGIGYKAGDGDIFSNNVSVATCDATAKLVVIGLAYDSDAGTATFKVADSEIATVSVTAGQTYYYAVSVGSTIAYDLSCYVVSGSVAFTYAQPDSPAWFTQTFGHGIIRVCGPIGFLTDSGDTPANVPFAPDLLETQQYNVRRQANVWPWSNQNSSSTVGSLALDNMTVPGKYDYLLDADVRNGKVTHRLQPANGTYADSFVVSTSRINTVKSDGEAVMRLQLGSMLDTLQRPLQNRIFPPYVDAGIANRPYPILNGACRNVPVPLVDQENRIFQLSDQPISNIAIVRDKGDADDPLGSPPDYTLINNSTQLQKQVLPEGKLTVDASNVGSQNVIPGVDDVLAGAGDFTTWTNPANPPDGWTTGGNGTIIRRGTSSNYPQDYVAEIVATDPWNPNGGKFGKWLKSPSVVLEAGKNYNIVVKLFRAVGGPPNPVGGTDFGLRLFSALDAAPSSAITPFGAALQSPLYRDDDVYTFPYSVPAGSSRFIYAVVGCAQGATSAIVSFYHIRAELIPITPPNVPIQGMTLFQMESDFVARALRQGIDIEWEPQDAIDIDDRLQYTSLGFYRGTDPIQIDAAMRKPLDSVCGVLCEDHLGRVRLRQLIDPATIDDGDVVIDLSEGNMMFPVDAEPDAATGLTTTGGVRFNNFVFTPTDFVTDYSPITGIDAATRTQFERDSQFLVTSTEPLSSFYDHARSADPIIFSLDDEDEGQTEINRVNGFYSTTPKFYTCTVYFDERNAQTLAQLLFGDCVRVTYKSPADQRTPNGVVPGVVRYGLDAKKLIVVDTNLIPAGFAIDLLLWG
jgi:hypothetical protein